MADKNMEAQISVEFEEATSRQSLNSGETINTLWSKVKRWLSDLKAVAFSGSYIDLSDKPTTATTDTNGLMSAEDKSKLDNADNKYALKSKYGDTTINVGRKADSDVGEYSTAEGFKATANGQGSHAEGEGTTASGEGSHAEGVSTQASGQCSHAEGVGSIASGNDSHAGGNGSQASGLVSFSHGIQTFAYAECEVAFGKYNISKRGTLFSIGDGTANNARHNAFEITTDGGKLHDKDIATTENISNPNLLINPDFRINQRSITGTFSETGKYFVDRWKLVSGTVTINSDGTLTLNGSICQPLENAAGTNVTASVSAGTAVYDDTTKTFTITGNGDIISWAKLEIGSAATLFVPPNITEEQIKCQRYYLGLNTYIRYPMTRLTSGTIDFIIPVNAMMRATPTINGTPIVYNNADVSAQSGFSFSIAAVGINAIAVRATKSNHGLTSAFLDVTNGVKLNAEI